MKDSCVRVKHAVLSIGGVLRSFVVLAGDRTTKVYELVVSERKMSAQLQATDPAIVPIVLRHADGQ